MTYQQLESLAVSVNDGVAVVTLNRPEQLNAINAPLLDRLAEAVTELGADRDVRAVVFTGAGDRAFAAGADIADLRGYTAASGLTARMQRVYDDIEFLEKPTIAAVNGFALGGGLELAMSCDIRIGSTSARLGLPELTLAVLPGAGGTQRLARLIGVGRAVEMILTGRAVDADEAQQIGLLTSVVSPEELLAEAIATARGIAAKGPLAVRLAKTVVRASVDVDQRTGMLIERLAQAVLYTTEDKNEGAEAFLSRRAPGFTGA